MLLNLMSFEYLGRKTEALSPNIFKTAILYFFASLYSVKSF